MFSTFDFPQISFYLRILFQEIREALGVLMPFRSFDVALFPYSHSDLKFRRTSSVIHVQCLQRGKNAQIWAERIKLACGCMCFILLCSSMKHLHAQGQSPSAFKIPKKKGGDRYDQIDEKINGWNWMFWLCAWDWAVFKCSFTPFWLTVSHTVQVMPTSMTLVTADTISLKFPNSQAIPWQKCQRFASFLKQPFYAQIVYHPESIFFLKCCFLKEYIADTLKHLKNNCVLSRTIFDWCG